MGFPKRVDTILNCTGLNCAQQIKYISRICDSTSIFVGNLGKGDRHEDLAETSDTQRDFLLAVSARTPTKGCSLLGPVPRPDYIDVNRLLYDLSRGKFHVAVEIPRSTKDGTDPSLLPPC